VLTKYTFEIPIRKMNKVDRSKASLVQREVAFSQENDGGIVINDRFLSKNNPSVTASRDSSLCTREPWVCATFQTSSYH
jgi:hypothetical protein